MNPFQKNFVSKNHTLGIFLIFPSIKYFRNYNETKKIKDQHNITYTFFEYYSHRESNQVVSRCRRNVTSSVTSLLKGNSSFLFSNYIPIKKSFKDFSFNSFSVTF